ncbi:MAG TPA: hypothetical protein VLB76_19380 [Thermoanaerobaculia bacterium]|nr:hypothetical protein [Thermoanaerobaculia bacterium]
MRRILANLLAEDDLAGRRRNSPPRTVLETFARMAVRLRAFAREGDRLWSPAPIGPGLDESGLLGDLPPAGEVLAWCETPEAIAHRGGPRLPTPISWDTPLRDLLWQLPTPPPAVVAAVHHRAFCLQVAEEIGYTLPGARMVESLAELDRVLRTAPIAWIVKAPLSASGRSRYIERNGPGLTDLKSRRTVERLFEHHGPLLFEPWMDRTEDFGVSALLGPDELRIVGIHGQRVDRKGQFAGIDLHPDISEQDRDQLLKTVEAVAAALRRAGYVGPFGIDAWRYRREDGSIALNPLGEINARMTFGLVEWAAAERLL